MTTTNPSLVRGDSFVELLDARVRLTPDAPFLLDELGGRVTFGQYRHRAERIAAALAAAGAGPGSRVVWQLPTRISTALLIGALARLGAVQAPVIPAYRSRETTAAVIAAGAEFLLVPTEGGAIDYHRLAREVPGSPRIVRIGVDAPELDEVTGLPAVADIAPRDSQDGRWVYFTSGSSGTPKAALHHDRSLISSAYGMAEQGRLGADPAEVTSMTYPIAHVGGIAQLTALIVTGKPTVLIEAFDPRRTAETLRRNSVTTTGGGPVFYAALLAEQRKDPDRPLIPSLRYLTGGGAPCPPSLYAQVRAEMGVTVLHSYGMTETPMICIASPLDSAEQLAETEGRPAPGMQVRIVEDGEPVAVGTDGDIELRGTNLFLRYLDEAATRAAFTADGWFRTGDRGHLRADGHLEVTGRTKDLIIRKGENIAPQEIEQLLSTHPAIAQVAVIGLPDAERGERVCAVVIPRDPQSALRLGDLTDFLRAAGVMPQKLPEQLEIAADLPRSGTGKVDKNKLRRDLDTAPAV
ncbi:class I adenylate-forming enzyme family protein [Nocardia jinanensis]|uniref:Cyclohexanecarboxylate-CoA ligase n=1 Tax=Nocardia jinanensis TaxID=382504 RepID=A0A917RK56_9NOCA|nr:class I adenylate-forming enzyme family protein [Nocardia jinanensis]GGL12418.1 cyclohexanecarboxylate-CoA ligase [Nocardia jinanensis]